MTRPQYESQDDRKEESKIARVIAASANCYAVKLPISYRLDYAFHDSTNDAQIRFWAEVKRRHNNHDAYPTYMVSLAKWMAAAEMNRITGKRVLFGIKYDDGVYLLKVTEKSLLDMRPFLTYAMGGRTDRGDAADIEPVVHIPMTYFEYLE